MRQVKKHLHSYQVELESLPLDERLFRLIIEDLREYAGWHIPGQGWLELGGGVNGAIDMNIFSARQLVDHWLGFGASAVSAESLFWYYQYLRDIDGLGLAQEYFESEEKFKPAAAGLRVVDLGTILDIGLVSPFVECHSAPLHVIEVGGGYGRLAEAFLNIYQGQVKYVLVDAVPASLVYAYEYLTRCDPAFRVGFYYRGDPFDLDRFDCYIVPTWHVERVSEQTYDLALNVQSMQEMDQHHVDYYLRWFDSLLRGDDGIAYFCNRRDHLFRGEWRYPGHWECVLKTHTPRSWVRDFPAEVFRKGKRSYIRENAFREALYRRSLEHRDDALLQAAAQKGYRVY